MEILTLVGVAGGVLTCLTGALIWLTVAVARTRRTIRALDATIRDLRRRVALHDAAEITGQDPEPRAPPDEPIHLIRGERHRPPA